MSLADFEVFLRERLQVLDGARNVAPGSPADSIVIQPILRRIGSDPFSADLGLFLQTRLAQEFPELAAKEGDAVTDLLVKMAMLLWDPLVRENQRVRNNLSFRDPASLSRDEAQALGANLFAEMRVGDLARGQVRIYFAQPQNVSISPENYFSSKGGLFFYPTEIQSIRVEEMLFNVEGSLYYFDVNVIAAESGDGYNVEREEIVSVANMAAAVRVTNKARFRFGKPEESTVEFVDRIDQDLSERSLVTLRGITAKITKAFPEVTRLNAIGFNDPEMQRDVIRGGGLGKLLAGGAHAVAIPDGEVGLRTRRLRFDLPDDVHVVNIVNSLGAKDRAYIVTLHDAFGELPRIRDLHVRAVVDARTVDLEEQVVLFDAKDKAWTLRRNEITLSGIPGGILFPDTPEGTIALSSDEVHVGGATDILVRGNGFDTASLVIANVVDDTPSLSGVALVPQSVTEIALEDLVRGTHYEAGDATALMLARAKTEGFSIQVLDDPIAGSYRVVGINEEDGQAVRLVITPELAVAASGTFRWKLLDEIDLDLLNPRESRLEGSDLRCIQGIDTLDTASGTDFDAQGVAPDDVLRVLTGSVAGDYRVVEVLTPLFRRIRVDRPLAATTSGLRYVIFRPNAEGGIELPLVRITSIDLLDTSAQPTGAQVPYARPVDVQSRAFANVARGVKADLTDVELGIVTTKLGAGVAVSGKGLNLQIGGSVVVTFQGPDPFTAQAVADAINTTAGERVALVIDEDRVGILPSAEDTKVTGGSAFQTLFGFPAETYSASDVRSEHQRRYGIRWTALKPALDPLFDVLQVLDGTQVGFYDGLTFGSAESDPLKTTHQFFPEVGRHAQVGARSIGSARVYFLEPTSFEVDPDARFTLNGTSGALRFLPDPTNSYQRIPALPSGVKPKDGVTVDGSNVFESASTDFILKGIQPGDELVIDYKPMRGTVELEDPVPNLNGKVLILSIGGGLDKRITFIRDSSSIAATHLTRQGVVDQINRAVGQTLASLTSDNQLEFNPDASLALRTSSAATANAILGFPTTGVDLTNAAEAAGRFAIAEVGVGGNPSRIRVSGPPFPLDTTRQQFRVFRQGLQRIVSTDMAKQRGAAKLYYFDVQLLSEGTGDQYNIAADEQLTVEGYRSDGYFLTTDEPSLSFSIAERPRLHLSRTILTVGASDDPANSTQLSGQNLQINYQRSNLVADVHNFASAETERVINQNPLGRHLIPYFVRFDLAYVGGAKEDDVQANLERHILDLYPQQSLEVGNIEKVLLNREAQSITNPIDLVAVVHNFDRTVTVERSKNRLNTGRLASFFPDVLTISRKLG